jgi:hypothetical protein
MRFLHPNAAVVFWEEVLKDYKGLQMSSTKRPSKGEKAASCYGHEKGTTCPGRRKGSFHSLAILKVPEK